MDLFDPKPALEKYAGKTFPGDVKYDNAAQASAKVLPSPWKFQQHGECGTELSELVPHLSKVVDDVCLIRSMRTSVNNHGQSIQAMNTGQILAGRPVLGSWLTYGLGSETQELPAYVALIDPAQLPVMGVENWNNGYLPSLYQGTVVRPTEPRILNLTPPAHLKGVAQAGYLDYLSSLNQNHLQQRPGELVDVLRADFQHRNEPNFAWKSCVSAGLALPALRAFWPMSSVDYAAATQARDVSGGGYHLANNNGAVFGYDNLIPYVEFDGVNQYLSRADGGAGNWADITGTEAYIAQPGLTFGGWFYFDVIAGGVNYGMIGKYLGAGNQRSYRLYLYGPGAPASNLTFAVSSAGTAVSTLIHQSGVVPTTAAWHFAVARIEVGVQTSIFLDGTWYDNVAGVPAGVFDGTASFEIGAMEAGTGTMNGKVSKGFLCAAAASDAILFSYYEQTRAMFGV